MGKSSWVDPGHSFPCCRRNKKEVIKQLIVKLSFDQPTILFFRKQAGGKIRDFFEDKAGGFWRNRA